MSEAAVRFIHKNGKIIPIRAAGGAGRVVRGAAVAAGAALAARHGSLKSQNKAVKINRKLDMTGLGLSVASGVLAAATFSGGAKGLAAGFVGSHALDAAGITANVASVAGKGHKVDRAKQAAKQEARNFVVGNAVFVGGLLGSSKNRAVLAAGAGKVLSFARKALRVVE